MTITRRQFQNAINKMDAEGIVALSPRDGKYIPVTGSTGTRYTVHRDTLACTCPAGQSGKFCKHVLAAVSGGFTRTAPEVA